MITNTGNYISEPRVDQVVFYKPWGHDVKKNAKPYPVIIKEGQYLSNGRLSNFWYWQRITPSGRIRPLVEHGYGNFTEATGYKLERKIVVTKEQ